jgi:ketosteroid isomerase-like protein
MSSTLARRSCAGALVMTFVATLALAQTTKPKADTGSTDRLVRSAQEQMLQAAVRGDKDGVGKFLADDLTWVTLNGQVQSKDQMLAALPAPVGSVDVQQVVPMGRTATVVAIVHMKDGTERRALQEWVNRDGEWKVLAHESAPIRAGATPASGMMGASPTGTSGGRPALEPRTVAPRLNSDDERAVWRAQTQIVDAYSKGDTSRYARLTADPFTRIETNGQVYNRRQWLDYVGKNAKQPLKDGAVSDVQIRIDNDTNLARVTMQIVPFNPDGTLGSPERQTRIFAKRNGRWQQVAAVGTPLPQR